MIWSDTMQIIPLTEQQLTFFNTFGFLSFPGLLKDRIDQIIEDYHAVWEAEGNSHHGKPHDGTQRSCTVQFVDKHPRLSTLLDDPRILGIAASILGDNFNYMGSDGNFYSGNTNWHSDGWHQNNILHIKLAFYLDPLTKDTGCLRVIPGSQKIKDEFAQELQERTGRSDHYFGMSGAEIPSYPLETQPGDLVCFNHNTKHAAFGGGGWRRMFTMNLCQRYPEEQIQELRDYLGGAARFWLDRTYAAPMVQTAGTDRMRHLEQVMANDGHLAELSRKARETMTEPSRG